MFCPQTMFEKNQNLLTIIRTFIKNVNAVSKKSAIFAYFTYYLELIVIICHFQFF